MSQLTLALTYVGTALSHISDAIDWENEQENSHPDRAALAERRAKLAKDQAHKALERAMGAVEGEEL